MSTSQLRARYWRLLAFFARVAAGLVVWEVLLPRLGLGRPARAGRLRRNRATAARFRAVAVRNGGLMVKVGQFFSARVDVLPPEITHELAGLQDEVPPVDVARWRAAAEADLGMPLEAAFAHVDPVPLAAASLGQVHRARLHPAQAEAAGFAEVVVKVQRPGIDQVVDTDLAVLRRVGGWLARYRPVARRADVPALVDEFAEVTRREVDYLAEATHAETFAQNFAGTPQVRVPMVVHGRTSRRVLTLEDVTALKITDHEAITAAGVDRAEVAHVLFDTYLQQVFEDGFFHADPHPGNLFVHPAPPGGTPADGLTWRLTFVDFGMVGRVPEPLMAGFRDLVVAVVAQDGPRMVRSFSTLGVLLPGADLERIEAAAVQLFERFGGLDPSRLRELGPEQFTGFVVQFQELLLDLPFQLPGDLLVLGRSVSVLVGICRGLDPDFNPWQALTPYARGLLADERGSTAGVVRDEAVALLGVAVGLPRRADRVLALVERGDLAVRTPRLDLRLGRLERAVDRLTTGVMAGSCLVAGALVHAGDRPLSYVLLALAAVLAAAALRRGRRRHPGL